MDPWSVAVVVVLLLLLGWYLYGLWRPYDVFRSGYFDYNATTPLYPVAAQAIEYGRRLGNAHAAYGQVAREELAGAEAHILSAVGTSPSTDYRIIWTSGGSEANNLLLRGLADSLYPAVPQYILSSTEHKTSLVCARELQRLGRITLTLLGAEINTAVSLSSLQSALDAGGNIRLVSIMHINNESGAINPLTQISAMLAAYTTRTGQPVILHTDAVQSLGRMPPTLGVVQAISFSAHKFGGPLGVGGLIVPSSLQLAAQIAGSQNHGLRGGTDNIPGILGTAVALRHSLRDRGTKNLHLWNLKTRIVYHLETHYTGVQFADMAGHDDTWSPPRTQGGPAVVIVPIGPLSSCQGAANTLYLSVVKPGPLEAHFCNMRLRDELQARGIIVSIGAACGTDGEVNHVLAAIGAPYVVRCGVIRISWGDSTTTSDCDRLCRELDRAIALQVQ
jgi:cysteine desulfurase